MRKINLNNNKSLVFNINDYVIKKIKLVFLKINVDDESFIFPGKINTEENKIEVDIPILKENISKKTGKLFLYVITIDETEYKFLEDDIIFFYGSSLVNNSQFGNKNEINLNEKGLNLIPATKNN